MHALLCSWQHYLQQPSLERNVNVHQTDEWIQEVWCIYPMRYYSTTGKNGIMPFGATWMDLETIVLSEGSQKEKHHLVSLICGIKHYANKHICETEADSQTQRTDSCAKVRGRGHGSGVWSLQMQTIIYRMDKQQSLTIQHRELYSLSSDKPYIYTYN